MAKGVIGNLRVNMGLDSAEFQAGLKSAQSSAERFSKSLKTGLVAAAGAATAALGAISVAVRRTISSANNLGYVADRLGVNIERLQELRYAAERGGMSINNFDVALRRFVRRSAEAARGTGAAKNAFKELGVELKTAEGTLRTSDEILHDVADAMQGVQNPADKLRLAFQMFDTDGAAMVNVLANGSAGMKDLAAEAQRLGLVLSEETVRGAQAMTNNFDMARSIMGGVINQLTTYLMPALVLVSEGATWLALKFSELISILPTVAEYTMVAGGALALMAAPAILSSIGAMTVAIGTGLVGAVKLLTAAIAANPLGALAVGIAAAVTAIYHFRDEIQKAIGVDVVSIVKDAANYIINSFRAAFEDVKFVWDNFGNIMGAAVIGGVNAAIRAINGLLERAAEGIDWLIDKANKVPLVNIDKIGGGGGPLKELANEYADQLAGANAAHKSRIDEIMASDAIAALGSSFAASTPAVVDFNKALENTNANLGEMGGGGKEGGGGGIDRMVAGLEQLRQSLMTAEEAERNSYANRLLAIQEYYDAGLIQKAEYDDLMERAHEEHTERMAEITRRGVEQEMRMRGRLVGNLSSVMGSLSSIIEQTGEKNLAAAKAFAVAEAVINTAQGITKALAQGGMFGFAGAAAVAAAGAAQIATILSSSKSSARRPAVSGSGGAAHGDARSDQRDSGTVNLQIQGLNRNELYSGEQVRDLMDKMVDLQRDGYQLLVVDQ